MSIANENSSQLKNTLDFQAEPHLMSTKSLLSATALSVTLSISAAFAQETDKFQRNPFAPVTEEDMRYVDRPGNEFTVTFRTQAFPQGRTVTIDPDDMIPVNDPRRNGRVVLAPRLRFFYEINNQLPSIPGREMPPLRQNEGLSPSGAVTMYRHLTDTPLLNGKGEVIGGGHGIPREQILDAMRRCHEARNIPEPEPNGQ